MNRKFLLCLAAFSTFRIVVVCSSYGNWATDFTFGSTVEQQSLRETIAESQGVYLCSSNPGAPTSGNNLASTSDSLPLKGWKGLNLESVSTDDGIQGFKTGIINSNTHGPELALTNLTAAHYDFSVWVKIEASTSINSSIFAAILRPGQQVTQGKMIATGVAKTECWTKLMGGFTLREASSVTLTIAGLPAGSAMSLASVYIIGQSQEDYYSQQNAIISQIRKRAVKLSVFDSKGKPFHGYIELQQIKNDFPFGGSVSGAFIASNAYRQWVKKRFSWGVFENELKWYHNEWLKNILTYDDPDRLLPLLEDMQISVRGHSILWDYIGYVQPWLQALNKVQLAEAAKERVRSVLTRYKGKILHWDVVNELTHGNFYENGTGNPNFASLVYQLAKEVDPNILTFVNDFNVIESWYYDPTSAERYLEVVSNVEKHGGPVDRIGIQGHFTFVDGPRVRAELDIIATYGKPVWITELDVDNSDPLTQADDFELAMREAFSHPIVEGIVLWGVARPNCTKTPWKYDDQTTCNTTCTMCLVDGNFKERPIGKRYLKLRKEWSTHRSQWMSGSMRFRGFFGLYRARMYVAGRVEEQTFVLPKGTETLQVHLRLS